MKYAFILYIYVYIWRKLKIKLHLIQKQITSIEKLNIHNDIKLK